jgi:hypothetical protein
VHARRKDCHRQGHKVLIGTEPESCRGGYGHG